MITPTRIQGIDGAWRSFDEHYDTQRAVASDPCGAHMAIQNQATLIRAQERKIASLTPSPAAEDYHLSEITGCLAEYRDMPTKSLELRLLQAVRRAILDAVQRQKAGGA